MGSRNINTIIALACSLFFSDAVAQGKPMRDTGRILLKTYSDDTMVFDKLRGIDSLMHFASHSQAKEFIRYFHQKYNTKTSRKSSSFIVDYYGLACMYALSKNPDKAFSILDTLVTTYNYSRAWPLGDCDLESLHKDIRWKKFAEQLRRNYYATHKQFPNVDLAFQLSVWESIDQSYIRHNGTIEGRKKFKQLNKSIVDSLTVILQTRGYPSPQLVGREAAMVPALILAHADSSTQIKFQKLLTTEGLKGNIPGGMAGVVIDKILVRQRKLQLYGTQGFYDSVTHQNIAYPIDNLDSVNQRRKKMGFLIPWSEYKIFQDSYSIK